MILQVENLTASEFEFSPDWKGSGPQLDGSLGTAAYRGTSSPHSGQQGRCWSGIKMSNGNKTHQAYMNHEILVGWWRAPYIGIWNNPYILGVGFGHPPKTSQKFPRAPTGHCSDVKIQNQTSRSDCDMRSEHWKWQALFFTLPEIVGFLRGGVQGEGVTGEP